jgi:L-amino acid N-acyltransferase
MKFASSVLDPQPGNGHPLPKRLRTCNDSPMRPIVRPAAEADLPRILEIYNHEVAASTATYDTEPRTEEEHRKWFRHHGPLYPVLVAECEGAVRGWASLSPWSERLAYSRSVEVSVYVALESRRAGLGRLLLQALVEAGRERGHHALLSRISSDNEASIRLHEALGFTTVGVLKEVGVKFGRLLDVTIMEMLL